MKNLSNALIALLLLAKSLDAQVPQTFSYQAVAKDQNGNLHSNKSLTIRIGVLQNENLVWQEDHPVTTNSMGLFTLKIGDPEALNLLGSVSSFSEIPWGDGSYRLQISVDEGSGFYDLGTSELLSVPFALYAADGPGGTGPQGPQGEPGPEGPPGADEQVLSLDGSMLTISGGNSIDLATLGGSGSQWGEEADTISTFNHVGIGTSNPNLSTLAVQGLNVSSEIPLFEVRREDGFPVFAVFNDGVQVYVDEEAKGSKGGFAVGGYKRTAKGITQDYLTVSSDSVRIYVPDEDVAKGSKGGFAVGGYQRKAKGPGQDLLFINADSTRIYVPNKGNDPGVVGLQGGFAVSGYSPGAKSVATDYLMGINRGITRFNTSDRDKGFAIGNQGDGWGSSYLELTPTNSFIGFDAGLNNMDIDPVDVNDWGLGTMNVFIGYQSGLLNVAGHHNTFMGFCAGTNTLGSELDPDLGSHNVFIGTQAGFQNTEGSFNVYMGHHAGFHNLEGTNNVFIGTNAGAIGTGTNASTMVGADAGREYDGAGDVTFIGRWAGNNNAGQANTYVGRSAGANSGSGSDNVGVGMRAGQYTTGNHNVTVGSGAGQGLNGSSSFSDNTLIGHNSGQQLTTGGTNVMVGAYTGQSNASGIGNVFIGNQAGFYETGSGQLYIDNSSTVDPLIWGSFASNDVIVYGDLQVNGTFFEVSDINLKKNVAPLSNSLDKVMELKGVSFEWTDRDASKGTDAASYQSIGVIAQDVEQVLPSLVREKRNGQKAVNYSGMIPVLLEAIKEQQSQIEALERRIAELELQ